MDYELLLEQCRISIEQLMSGSSFLLKDLFMGTEWQALNKGVRLELGRRFKLNVQKGVFPNIEYIGKADNNSTLYRKNKSKSDH